MTEFQFYNWIDPIAKNEKKPRYESRKIILNQAQV